MVEKKDVVVNLDWTKEFGPAFSSIIVNGELKILETNLFQTSDLKSLITIKKVIDDTLKVIEREKKC